MAGAGSRINNRCAIYGTSGKYGSPEYTAASEQASKVVKELIRSGVNTFVTSARDGHELNLALYILNMKSYNKDIHLVTVRPYEGYSPNWRTRDLLQNVIDGSDMVKYIADQPGNYVASDLDKWIVAHCGTILCVKDNIGSRISRLSHIDLSGRRVIDLPETSHRKERSFGSADGHIDLSSIVVSAHQTPGRASFDNYEELRDYLESGLEIYRSTVYSSSNIEQAKRDHGILKAVKKRLTDTRRALKKSYEMPIEAVLEQLDELIDMVKEPYNEIDKLLKANARESKRLDIMSYARSRSGILGRYALSVIESPAFLNPKWLNASYSDTKWMHEADEKILNAGRDIEYILAHGDVDTGVVLGYYFDKLSLSGIDAFLENVRKEDAGRGSETVYIDINTGEVVQAAPEDANSHQDLAAGNTTQEGLGTSAPGGITPDDTSVSASSESEIASALVSRTVTLHGDPEQIRKYIDAASDYGVTVSDAYIEL